MINRHTKHEYKGVKILKIWDCGQVGYAVEGMNEDFYKRYWGGIFATLKDAKRYIDNYTTEQEA